MKSGEATLFVFAGIREGDQIFVPIRHIETIEPSLGEAKSRITLVSGRTFACRDAPEDVATMLQSFIEGKLSVDSFALSEIREAKRGEAGLAD